MIRAANDYDAIRARMDELAGVTTVGVDIEWFISPLGYYVYEPVSKRAIECFVAQGYVRGEYGFSFGITCPDEMKKYTPATNFVFKERV